MREKPSKLPIGFTIKLVCPNVTCSLFFACSDLFCFVLEKEKKDKEEGENKPKEGQQGHVGS